MAEPTMDQCHCCNQWFIRIEVHYARSGGACFPEPLTGGQCKRSRTAKTRKPVESNDSSDDSDSMLGTEVDTSMAFVAVEIDEDVRSTRSKRKRLDPDPFDTLSRMTASSEDSFVSSGGPAILQDNDLGDDDAPSPPPSPPPPPPPPMTTNSNSPPPLGTEYYYPALDALQNMPHLSEQEEAQLLLLEILDGCPNYVYDKVVSHIESHIGSVYTVGVPLYRREPLLSRLSKNFPVPPPHDVIVPLETNEEGAEDGHRRPGSTVVVPRGTLERLRKTFSCAQSFLVTPITSSTRLFHSANTLAQMTAVTENCLTATGTAKRMMNEYPTHRPSSSFQSKCMSTKQVKLPDSSHTAVSP